MKIFIEEIWRLISTDPKVLAFEQWAYSLWPFYYFPRYYFDLFLIFLASLFYIWLFYEWAKDFKNWIAKKMIKIRRKYFKNNLGKS